MSIDVFSSYGFSTILGIDEAGRGAIAGPMAFAAFFYDSSFPKIKGITDSKKLSEKERYELFFKIGELYPANTYDVVLVDEKVIDKYGVAFSIKLALSYFCDFVSFHSPDIVVVDGNYRYNLGYQYVSVKKADEKIYSVSVASILAKVVRDRYMYFLSDIYPDYGFSRHKGYPTKSHREALQRYGILPIHRKSYKLI
jgi:ribonuclease HII